MTFIEKVGAQGMIFDGALGTMLIREGLGGGKASEFWILEKPEIVQAIHKSYFDAGADIVTTNTFGASVIKLQKSGLAGHAERINVLAVQTARAAGSKGKFVAGDIGPLGDLLEPSGTISVESAVDAFSEQAEALSGAGADVIIVETMFDLDEALAAIKGIQSVCSLPILATLTFQRIPSGGFATMMGNRVEVGMKTLRDAGAFAVGANCSIGSDAMVDLAREIRNFVDIPVIIQPNAGIPEIKGLETVYPESVEYFLKNIRIIKSEGIEIVGGCCGTTPEYIRIIAETIFNKNPH
jgi:5-methyltetrahydrofolate--homocysteine methyltransferase